MNWPKSVFIPTGIKNQKMTPIKFEEFSLHRFSFTNIGSYYDKDGQNKNISLNKINFLNSLRQLYYIIIPLTDFASSDHFLSFWRSKLDPQKRFKKPTKEELIWLTMKIFSASNSFWNNSFSLLYSVHLIFKQIMIENGEEEIDISLFKKNLIIDTYSIVEAFLVNMNSIYLFLNKTGSNLVKYDQNLNKLEIIINKAKKTRYSEFLEITKEVIFKEDFEKLSKIRNIIVHPFSLREGNKNHSYWQIAYTGQMENKNRLDYDKVFISKMSKSNVKDINWINIPKQKFEYSEEIEILNLSIRLLNEISKYFGKDVNFQNIFV